MDRIPVAREGELYSLKWHTFESHLKSGLKQLLFDDILSDVTLVAEGKTIRSHRMLLSLCSPQFKQLFLGNASPNVIVILNNVRYQDLQHVIQFIYNGEVKVSNNHELQRFLQVGELLQIEGLTKSDSKHETERHEQQGQEGGQMSPSSNAQSGQVHRRSHIQQVPPTNSTSTRPSGSQQIPVTSSSATISSEMSSHQQSNFSSNLNPPPTKRLRPSMPTSTVTSATYPNNNTMNENEAANMLGHHSPLLGGDGGDPLALMDEAAGNLHHQQQQQQQPGVVTGIEDQEQEITIDSIKSEGLYVSEDDVDESFEMTHHGDVSGLGAAVECMYGDNSGAGPSSAITTGAHVKPPGVGRKHVFRRIRKILGKNEIDSPTKDVRPSDSADYPSLPCDPAVSTPLIDTDTNNICTLMKKFKFPYPKRGIGKMDLEEELIPSVWDFFQFSPISDKSICNFCGYSLSGKNCTNLRVHLKSRHADLFVEFAGVELLV